MVRLLASGLLALSLVASPAGATSQQQINATLRADAQIWEGLYTLALADHLREICPTLEARTFRATRFVYSLYSQARSYGFSRAEIRAFQVDDDVAADLRARVTRYLDENGVREGVPETYCVLGAAEIAADTPVGALLRAR